MQRMFVGRRFACVALMANTLDCNCLYVNNMSRSIENLSVRLKNFQCDLSLGQVWLGLERGAASDAINVADRAPRDDQIAALRLHDD